MAGEFKLSEKRAAYPPQFPLVGGDLLFISQFRDEAWSTAVISLEELVEMIAETISLDASRITAGTLPIARGGTNATTDTGARTSLGAASLGANTFTGNQAVTGIVSATGGFDDTSA
jgi:hypothetical protein